MADTSKDSRFDNILKDPRYRPLPKRLRKVNIDKRFQSMFTDKRFKVKYTVDKRGRPVNETSTENLRKYYNLDSDHGSISENENEDIETTKPTEKKLEDLKSGSVPGRFVRRQQSDDESSDEEEANNLQKDKLIRDKLDHKTREKLQNLDIDYARGEGALFSGSSSSDDSSDQEEESDVEHLWGELDGDAERTEESTKRIAICNMDWDNIKATDIMVLLNSFIPAGGIIHKIAVYPSEYGIKRMQEEELRGPIELTEDKPEEQSDDDGNEEGSVYHMEKLRRYQLNRLKYYYAVVECDTIATADKLYGECDGMEYESSATKLDLRFIPDDVTFDQEPREVCTKLPDMAKYRPRLFTTTALQQAKVELTWDATNPNRAEAIKGALGGKIDDLDLKEYLASNSSEDENEAEKSYSENEDEDPIQKYKNLLEEIEQNEDKKKNKDMEMEITWGWGIKDKAEELVKKKMNEDNKNLTPFEELLRKRKEKKKQKKLENTKPNNEKGDTLDSNSSDEIPSDIDMNDSYFAEEFNKSEFKKTKSKTKKQEDESSDDGQDENVQKKKAELELLLDDDDGKAHFSLKKIQDSESNKKSKRRKKLKEKMMEQKTELPDFEVNVNDDRFSALYDSHLFHIDPNNPNYKKTKNMEKIIQEKLKRRPVDVPSENEIKPKKSKEDAELSLLVKNIKRKTKKIH